MAKKNGKTSEKPVAAAAEETVGAEGDADETKKEPEEPELDTEIDEGAAAEEPAASMRPAQRAAAASEQPSTKTLTAMTQMAARAAQAKGDHAAQAAFHHLEIAIGEFRRAIENAHAFADGAGGDLAVVFETILEDA